VTTNREGFRRWFAADGQQANPLLIASWFGLLTGLIEVAILVSGKLFFHKLLLMSPHVVWMAPLTDLILFGIIGIVLFLVQRWLRIVSEPVIIFIFAFLSFLGLGLMFTWLQHYAALLLAAGLAVQTARLSRAHPAGFRWLVRRTTAPMLALTILMAAGMYGWQLFSERRAMANLKSTPPNSPNVLFIVLDTVRAESLSVYGNSRPTTPQLERLAKNGVRFEYAISPAPWTLISHSTIFTGHFPHELSADWEAPLDTTYRTLAEDFRDHGYATAGFVANMIYCSYETGLNQGFTHYEDYPLSISELVLSSSLLSNIVNSQLVRRVAGNYDVLDRKSAAQVNHDFLSWLSHNNQKPFFVFLNYFDAHEPYMPHRPFDTKFGQPAPRNNDLVKRWAHEAARLEKESMSPAEIQAELDAYEGSIAYLDQQLGLLFDELKRRNVLDNTLVVITADHGEQFGEHGIFTHGNSLYLQTLRVPLLILFPSRLPADTTITEPVTLRDLPATIADLVPLGDKGRFPGNSLTQFWNGTKIADSANRSPLLSEVKFGPDTKPHEPLFKGDMRSLVIDRKHYILNGDGRAEVYDLETDPQEKKDIAGSDEGRQITQRFQSVLKATLENSYLKENGKSDGRH
jgi:arylsulfatase A-like enzyme